MLWRARRSSHNDNFVKQEKGVRGRTTDFVIGDITRLFSLPMCLKLMVRLSNWRHRREMTDKSEEKDWSYGNGITSSSFRKLQSKMQSIMTETSSSLFPFEWFSCRCCWWSQSSSFLLLNHSFSAFRHISLKIIFFSLATWICLLNNKLLYMTYLMVFFIDPISCWSMQVLTKSTVWGVALQTNSLKKTRKAIVWRLMGSGALTGLRPFRSRPLGLAMVVTSIVK